MKKQRKWAQLYSIQTNNHQIKSAYQMNPIQLEDVRRALVSSSRKDDFKYFLMIFFNQMDCLLVIFFKLYSFISLTSTLVMFASSYA